MKDKEVAVKRGIPLKVTLASDVQTLNEVVVTGVQKMDKRLFTGATDQLSASNVKLDGVPDISRSLEGRSAGVSVQNVRVPLVRRLKFVFVVLLLFMVVPSL